MNGMLRNSLRRSDYNRYNFDSSSFLLYLILSFFGEYCSLRSRLVVYHLLRPLYFGVVSALIYTTSPTLFI